MRTWVPFFAFRVTAMVNPLLFRSAPRHAVQLAPIQENARGTATARHIGAIKTIAGNLITVAPDSGSEIGVIVEAATRVSQRQIL